MGLKGTVLHVEYVFFSSGNLLNFTYTCNLIILLSNIIHVHIYYTILCLPVYNEDTKQVIISTLEIHVCNIHIHGKTCLGDTNSTLKNLDHHMDQIQLKLDWTDKQLKRRPHLCHWSHNSKSTGDMYHTFIQRSLH